MNSKDCLDIGIIQAFLDGELRQDETARVSTHIANCDNCAIMLANAEEETAIVFPALEREFNTLVPTQRLWNKINDSINTERGNRSFWHQALAFFSLAIANPSLSAAAALLIVFGVFAAFWVNRPVPVEVALTPSISQTAANIPVASTVTTPAYSSGDIVSTQSRPTFTVERAAFRAEPRKVMATKTMAPTLSAAPNGYMPGEESYVRTIYSLNKTVNEQKEAVLRPSERIAYERDMAVVNDTIKKMRTEVKKNPKNESAKQVLYSSYQNKIDLLNSVAQKEELVASLR